MPDPSRQSIAERFATPMDVDAVYAAFGGDALDLMPPYKEIPREFGMYTSRDNPFTKIQREWFFRGLKAWPLKPRPGIDQAKAIRHLSAIQASFDPPHEHKVAAVAYLMSLWFEPPGS